MTDRHGTLKVTGTGEVRVAPDEAVVHLGIITEGKTASEAVASNARRTQETIDAVSTQPNHGVTTTGLSVYPIMSYDPDTGVGRIVGFRATNGVEVKTKVGYAGQIYDAGLDAGANQSWGVTFRVQNEIPHRMQALHLAVEKAYTEAKVVAKAAQVELKGVESIEIDARDEQIFYRAKALDSREVATQVMPEEQTIAASVQILFRTRG